jgi:L-rhamnose-H+ transport protein
MCKEKELSDEKKKETIKEFNFSKGVWVAIFAGIMSACMIFGIEAGKPISELAFGKDSTSLWTVSPIYIFVFAGGFTTNFLCCVYLNRKNRTGKDYINAEKSPLLNNYFFCSMAGIIWYLQFMFYGMGETRMGDYSFSSWTIHMAFIIVFSNIWALILREWKGSSKRTLRIICLGILVLIVSICVVGLGSYLKKAEQPAAEAVAQSSQAIMVAYSK